MGTTYLRPVALLLSFTVFVVLYANYIHTFPKPECEHLFHKAERQNTELAVPHVTCITVVMFL
jgi:hypothetical protein